MIKYKAAEAKISCRLAPIVVKTPKPLAYIVHDPSR